MRSDWRKSARLRLPIVASALLLLAGLGSAQPANDECASPVVLLDGTSAALTNVGATTNPGDPMFTCAPAVDDVWFTYTPSCSGTVVLAMCPAPAVNSIDAVMEVFSGSCGSLTLLACDDDGCPGTSGGSQIVLPGVTAGVPLTVRVGSFNTMTPPVATGTFSIFASCTAVVVDDFGDASGLNFARHTNAVAGQRLGTAVTGDAVTPTPAWYGDAGDDGIVSVANLSPGTTTGQVVVSATNPFASSTSFCRLWVDRNNGVGWSPFSDAFPMQSATVGAAPVNFTFGPFSMLANSPPSPFVRVRLASSTVGMTASIGTAAFGECEDYVLPGTGGPVMAPVGGNDAGDAPLPYPPANSTVIISERLGAAVSATDANAPVGFGVTTGTAAWDDDAGDDGIVRLEGLVPGGSCTLVLRAVDPLGTFTDDTSAWMDFDGDGSWDDIGEAFAPVTVNIGPTPVTVTLGPLAVPASVGSTVATRLKVAYVGDPQSVEAAGTSFEFGEIEDYLLPVAAGTGCGIGPNGTPTIWAEDPPRQGLPFTWKEANLSPGSGAFLILDSVNFLPGGIDVFLLAGPIVAPGTCFLYTGLTTIAPIGAADPNGDLSVTLPVPAGSAGTVYLQSFQIGPALTIFMTPVLPLTILP